MVPRNLVMTSAYARKTARTEARFVPCLSFWRKIRLIHVSWTRLTTKCCEKNSKALPFACSRFSSHSTRNLVSPPPPPMHKHTHLVKLSLPGLPRTRLSNGGKRQKTGSNRIPSLDYLSARFARRFFLPFTLRRSLVPSY